tara:strand:- start:119 stop:598 length:480 start_codon:yes stop_codon:yes gene_type:complete
MIFKNKKATSVSIVVLVVLTLLLVSITLFYFVVEKRDTSREVAGVAEFNRIYEKEKLLDFHVQEVIDRGARGATSDLDFIANAQIAIDSYIKENNELSVPELDGIRNQLPSVELIQGSQGSVGSVSIELELSIGEAFFQKQKKAFSGNYTYTKTFVSET